MTEQNTLIGLSGGEWQSTTLDMFTAAKIPLTDDNSRRYERQFSITDNVPAIDFLFCRSKDVVAITKAPDSEMRAATIGSDFALEQNYPFSYILPLYRLLPSTPQACLYIAATPNWQNVDVKNPQWKQLNNTKVFTPYPNIAKKYLERRGVSNARIEFAAGKIEGLSRAFRNNLAYIDLKSDKNKPPRTGEANGNKELDTIMNVDLVLVTKPELTSLENARITSLMRTFYQAAKQTKKD